MSPIFERPHYELSEEYRQLALALDVETVEEGQTPAVAHAKSEAALRAFMALQGTGIPPSWYGEFEKVMQGGWPWRQAAYIAWAATPKEGRFPKTQDELAKQFLGLTSDRAISTWVKRNPAIITTIAELQSATLWDHRADYFKSLDEGARQAGKDYKFFNHLKLTLEILGVYVPVSELRAYVKRKNVGDLSEKSEDELEDLAKEFREEMDPASPPAADPQLGESAASPQIGEHDLGGEEPGEVASTEEGE